MYPGLQILPSPIEKPIAISGFGLNGSQSGLAEPHVTHSKG
jgi:hypothetical protein